MEVKRRGDRYGATNEADETTRRSVGETRTREIQKRMRRYEEEDKANERMHKRRCDG